MIDPIASEITQGIIFLCCCVWSVAACMILTEKEQDND